MIKSQKRARTTQGTYKDFRVSFTVPQGKILRIDVTQFVTPTLNINENRLRLLNRVKLQRAWNIFCTVILTFVYFLMFHNCFNNIWAVKLIFFLEHA